MDRLTKRGHKKLALLIGTSCSYGYMSYDCQLEEGNELLKSALDKLAMYEDLEEQDRLPKLPCKVGDTVYYINPNENTINELVVYSFDIRPLQHFACDYMGARLNFNQFGKTVFLTKEEAKAAMDKLKGKYNKDIERD